MLTEKHTERHRCIVMFPNPALDDGCVSHLSLLVTHYSRPIALRLFLRRRWGEEAITAERGLYPPSPHFMLPLRAKHHSMSRQPSWNEGS